MVLSPPCSSVYCVFFVASPCSKVRSVRSTNRCNGARSVVHMAERCPTCSSMPLRAALIIVAR